MVMLDAAVRNAMLDRKLPLLGNLLAAGAHAAVYEGGHLQIDVQLDDDDALWGAEAGMECGPQSEEQVRNTLYVSERLFHVAIRRCQKPLLPLESVAPAPYDVQSGPPAPVQAAPQKASHDVSVPETACSGPEIVKAGFSTHERKRIEAARGETGPSDWARSVVLGAVRSGRVLAVVPGAGSKPTYINFRMSAQDVAALDVVRGHAARAAFVRAAILAAC